MFEYLRKFKKILISSLTLMMAFVLLLSAIELGWTIAKDVITPPVFLLDINELLEIFGLFMLARGPRPAFYQDCIKVGEES